MSTVRSVSVPGVIAAVRERQPLVHCIASTVSMALIADGLLAAGARPMMTETVTEAPALTGVADALLVNLGTLSADGALGIPPTVAESVRLGHPWVLDPTAIGRAPVRTPLARGLLAHAPAVVRANASEVLALAGEGAGGRGADSTAPYEQAAAAAGRLAAAHGTVVALSGATDLVTDGTQQVRLSRGTPMLTRVTGTGCLLGGLVAACAAVAPPVEAAVAATAWLSVAGERAGRTAAGPGSFRVGLVDALCALTPDEVAEAVHP